MKQDNWTQATTIWQKVMKPLVTTVVPAIECEGVLNIEREARVHPCYEIEAQENGRMSCTGSFQWGINALTIGEEVGSKLRPRSLDDLFLYFDYQNMEVAVLQWLAQDDDLGEILAGDDDVYETLFKRIIGGQHQNSRKFAKSFFLPTIYGMSASGLAQKCKLPEPLAQKVIHRLNEQFAKSFRYVERFQEDAKQGVVRDHFGRKRFFSDSYHKARNTAIQSPATAICLERLVALHELKVSPILMSIHDGFVVSANAKNVTDVYMAVKNCLQAESLLAPGLKLKVSCKAGRSLSDKEMTPIIAHGSQSVPEGES
jgi:DNA polymerase I-like protein with 3'-5' exonuclease and polymerase domains